MKTTKLAEGYFKVENKDLKTIMAERLKKERIKAGKTQDDIRKLLGYSSSSTVSDHEKGKTMPRPEELFKLANLYGVTFEYLAGASEYSNLSTPEINILSKEEQQLLSAYRDASNRDKSLVRQILFIEER
jgi:transcriptional regulator with XRE-family HTH domain